MMNRIWTRLALSTLAIAACTMGPATAQSLDTPMTRLRPIGEPSAVDQYRRPAATTRLVETAYQNNGDVRTRNAFADSAVRQTAMLQQFEAPQLPATAMPLPPNNFSTPGAAPNFPSTGPSVVGPSSAQPIQPRLLPSNQGGLQSVPLDRSGIASSSDFAPLAQPQLGSNFATIDNCNCVSAPSYYSAASGIGCGTPVSYNAPQTYVAPPAQIAGPAILPSGFSPPQASGAPFGSLITFGQQANQVQVGQGIIGQPVAYVPGQPVRNWIRYIFP